MVLLQLPFFFCYQYHYCLSKALQIEEKLKSPLTIMTIPGLLKERFREKKYRQSMNV